MNKAVAAFCDFALISAGVGGVCISIVAVLNTSMQESVTTGGCNAGCRAIVGGV